LNLGSTPQPAFSSLDTVTLQVSAENQATAPLNLLGGLVSQLSAQDQQLASSVSQSASEAAPANISLLNNLTTENIIETSALMGATFLASSDLVTSGIAAPLFTNVYFGSPRLVAVSSTFDFDTTTATGELTYTTDILQDSPQVVVAPTQSADIESTLQFMHGFVDSVMEGAVFDPASQSFETQPTSAWGTLLAAIEGNTPALVVTPSNLAELDSLPLSAEAKARITAAVQLGDSVLVPTAPVTINGSTTVAWLQVDPTTDNVVAVAEDGTHGDAITDFGAIQEDVATEIAEGVVAGTNEAAVSAAEATADEGSTFLYQQYSQRLVQGATKKEAKKFALHSLFEYQGWVLKALLTESDIATGGVVPQTFYKVFEPTFTKALDGIAQLIQTDPPLSDFLVAPASGTLSSSSAAGTVAVESSSAGALVGSVVLSGAQLSGALSLSWQSNSTVTIEAATLTAPSATVENASGQVIGTGVVGLNAGTPVPGTIAGNDKYQVNGNGTLALYAPAESALGMSASWISYSASVTGSVTIVLTTTALTLDGAGLPAGSYTIIAPSATLSGGGLTTSASFSTVVSGAMTNGTINLGPGSGSVTNGGSALDVTSGATMTGYTGSIAVTAGGANNTDTLTLNGNAVDVLTVSATPTTLTTDDNTPLTFQANVNTNFADTYNVSAQAPAGWNVAVDNDGSVTATPAAGLQAGTYPIQVIAQSTTNPSLVAQTTVDVTVTPTTPGMTLAVNPDSSLTVPFDGAELPTAFQASLQNLGPSADTYNLTFSNVPAGFTLLNSGTSVTVPARQTGVLGLYLEPNSSQTLPPPGTVLSFVVTASSATNSAITQTVTVTFTMPALNAVAVTDNPTQVNTLPGLGGTTTPTLQNVGNASESEAVLATTSPGLTLTGLSSPVSLGVGGSATQTLTLTPAANTPLNSFLLASLTVGPAATQNVVSVVNVNVSPSFTDAGQTVNVSADVLNGMTATEQAQVFFTVIDGSGDVVFTSSPVPLTLSALTNVATVNLGSLDTSALVPGQYTVQVSIADSQGQPISGATGTGTLVIGSPVTASLGLDSDAFSPDDINTVTSTLTVNNQTNSGMQSVTASVTVPTNGAATVVPGSFSMPPSQIIPGNGSETLVWDLTLSAGSTQQIAWEATLNGLQPGQVVQVSGAAQIDGTSQQFTLPTQNVAGVPETQTIGIPVDVVAPGVPALANAAGAAEQLGNTNLANQLNDLSTALTNLVENPTDPVSKSQALASLQSILSLLAVDPTLVDFVQPLSAAEQTLANAQSATDIQAAVVGLGNVLDNFGATVVAFQDYNLTVALSPTSQPAQPGVPQNFSVIVEDTGTQQATYNLTLLGLPADVTGSLNQTSVTLNPGEVSSGIVATLTETSTTELSAFDFQMQASAAGFPQVVQTATGSFETRAQFVSVPTVTPNPPFANAGTPVSVSATLVNAVNSTQSDLASFVVTNSTGQQLFASTPVPVQLTLQSSVVQVNLGTIDTTGFALGQYTITVTITDSGGNPIAGATGSASLLIGSPVTASLTVSPQQVPPGNSTVTDTLQINSNVNVGNPLTLVGQIPISSFLQYGSTTVDTLEGLALNPAAGYLYVFGDNAIHVINYTNPDNPVYVMNAPNNGETDGIVSGTGLIGVGPGPVTNIDALQFGALDYFDLTSPFGAPDNPGNFEGANFHYQYAGLPILDGSNLLVPVNQVLYNSQDTITQQTGTVLSFTVNPSQAYNPNIFQLSDELFNSAGTPGGGNNNIFEMALDSAQQTLYVGSSSSTGSATQTGVGQLLVVNVSNPNQINSDPPNNQILATLDIPGTVQVHGVAIDGNLAFVVASQGGWLSPFTDANDIGPTGNLVLATVDISNPLSPQLIDEQVIPRAARGGGDDLISLGNDLFAFSSLGAVGDTPQLFVVNASDPNNIDIVAEMDVPGAISGLATDGNYLYASGDAGLTIYQLGVGAIPVTAQVQIPNGTAVAVVPGSFNVAPTIIPGTAYNTLQWTFTLNQSAPSQTLTWQTQVTGLQPGQSQAATLQTTIAFTSEGTNGQVTLPAQNVFAAQVLGLTPATQTVQPGASATYTLTIANPATTAVTYNLSVEGVPASWVQIPAEELVPAGGSVTVPLTPVSDPFAPTASYGFVVSATVEGTTGSVQGTLVLAGAALAPPPDPDAHGIVVSLTPAQATAGQGTTASFVVSLTNTGSTTDTFALGAALPTNILGTFSQTAVTIPPGASNFLDVTLTLTPQAGTAVASDPFTVTATSTTDPSVGSSAAGTLNVVANGVAVTLNPLSGAPGSGFQLTVINTGTVQDTFDLSLGGPAALVASLATSTVTLTPGASQVVPITTTAVNFADAGPLNLTAMASSVGNSAVQASASAVITILSTTGLTAAFSPPTQVLQAPGTSSFLLEVNNTGNTEESYTATITGTTGPLTASLTGLDGQPTQTIPTFILPGLSTGAILLNTDLTGSGQGTVTVQVQSLTQESISATSQAEVIANAPTSPTTVTVNTTGGASSVYGQSVTFTATVSATNPGAGTPTGAVQFLIGGQDAGSPVTLSGGTATLVISSLSAGSAAVTAVYTSDSSSIANSQTSGPFNETVSPAPLTVSADNESRAYGSANPTLSYTFSGLVNGDSASVFTGSLATAATANSTFGSYSITQGTLAAGSNYTINFTAGTLTVVATPNERFINLCYIDLLGRRVGDVPGVLGWSSLLDAGVSRLAVVQMIENAPQNEYRYHLVDQLYEQFLHRSGVGDPGVAGWVAMLQAGDTVEQVEAGIVNSPEYIQDRTNGTFDSWLTAFYDDTVGQAPDASDRAAWDAYAVGKTDAEVALAIMTSAPPPGATANEYRLDLVNSFYEQLLDRTAVGDPGQATWASQLQAGVRYEEVVALIVADTNYNEFYDIAVA
jgi:uncharacterized membrane protein